MPQLGILTGDVVDDLRVVVLATRMIVGNGRFERQRLFGPRR